MTEDAPLSVLLSQVWAALVMEIDNAVEAAAPPEVAGRFRISYPMWANALRAAEESTIGQVERTTGARANLPGLERWGWLHLGDRRRGDPDFGSSRGLTPATPVRLTRAGVVASSTWPTIIATVEDRWERRFSASVVADLRDSASAIGSGMPWAPPEVHPSDGFFSRPLNVRRETGSPPLVATLGRALTAVTVQRETGSALSLPLAANVVRVLVDAPASRGDLSARTGLSREAVTMSVSWLERNAMADRAGDGSTRITDRGRKAAASVPSGHGRSDGPLGALLEGVLTDADALREGLEPPPGCWRGQPPHLTRTRRFLAEPRAALPRQVMPLHRGGWPDGS